MKIRDIILIPYVLDKLAWKHQVSEEEVRQVLRSHPRIRFVEKGDVEGEHVYSALGQSDSGRYLIVFFIYKKTQEALVLSARDMNAKERRRYARR